MAKNTPQNAFLFVYGTLMKGFHESWQRDLGARLVGTGSIKARLYDLGDFPAAVKGHEGNRDCVKGELYQFSHPELALRRLDEFEGFSPSEPHRSLFVRSVVPVQLEGGARKRAWVYLYNRSIEEARRIPSGSYRDKVEAEL